MFNHEFLRERVDRFHNKKIILWGAGPRAAEFIDDYCGPGKMIPQTFAICDSTRNVAESEINGVRVIPFSEMQEMPRDEIVLIITAGIFELKAAIIPNQLYYHEVYDRRSFDCLDYLEKNLDLCHESVNLLFDQKSKDVYVKRIHSVLNGAYWEQSLFEHGAYFNNDLIDKVPSNGAFVFAGAFNGKHIDRALANNPDIEVIACEPNHQWYTRTSEKFKSDDRVKLHNRILWDDFVKLPFHDDMVNTGLAARVDLRTDDCSFYVETTTIDHLAHHKKVSEIALDVEGSEQHAVRGATNTIQEQSPPLCICLYHHMDDYFKLPHLIHEVGRGKYKLHVKQHSCVSLIETVLYAI